MEQSKSDQKKASLRIFCQKNEIMRTKGDRNIWKIEKQRFLLLTLSFP